MEKQEKPTLLSKIKSMLHVDLRRMFTMRLFYILAGIIIVVPILILVMTSMMNSSGDDAGSSFTSVWQMLGTLSSNQSAGMDILSMCNINLLYFGMAVLVSIFVSDDFKSGYAKNLFTTRGRKINYVVSKTLTCVLVGMIYILLFIIGSIIGGSIVGLSFGLEGFNIGNLLCCILSKLLLMLVFVPIFVLAGTIGKQRLWLSMIASFGIGMLLFTMIPMITPLDSTALNPLLILVGGLLFSAGLGAISTVVLKKTSLV
ncbi:MAG: ABC transporter permease [Bacilli bacterium]